MKRLQIGKFLSLAAAAIIMLPATAFAQSVFDGSWKIDVTSIDHPAKPVVHVFKDGMYECKSCVPKLLLKFDGRDFLNTHESLCGRDSFEGFFRLVEGLACFFYHALNAFRRHVGVDKPWAHGVHGDPCFRVFRSHRSHEPHHRMFRRAVGGSQRIPRQAGVNKT